MIGLLHDPVTWYKITHAGEQVAQWDFQNKGRSRWTGTSCFVLCHVTRSCKAPIRVTKLSLHIESMAFCVTYKHYRLVTQLQIIFLTQFVVVFDRADVRASVNMSRNIALNI